MFKDAGKIKNILGIAAAAIGAAFVGMRIFWVKVKRGKAVYKNEPEQQNPFEGKKVIFIEDENVTFTENADGVRGHLETVGISDYKPGIYDKYIKRIIDIILSFRRSFSAFSGVCLYCISNCH